MNFYTLTYDADLPAAQQVNIPTNTDYKLGVKVRRNGQIQNLNPESVTLGTLSADTEKTNGYVTFTLSSDDNASYTQETLSVDKGYDAEFYKPAFVEQNTTGAAIPVVISADLSDFIGQTLKPEDVNYAARKKRSGLTIDDIEANFGPYWRDNDDSTSVLEFKPFIEDKDGNTKIWTLVSSAIRKQVCDALGWPLDKPGFFITDPNDQTQYAIVESYTVQEGDKLVMGKGTISNTWYYGGKISITAGIPFSASFTFNINIFKSQQGDINVAAPATSTVAVEGTYADGTEFSFDFVTK